MLITNARLTSILVSISLLTFFTPQAEAQQPHSWIRTGSLTTGRFGHTSTLLLSGKVLVTGGRFCAGGGCTEFSSAEIFDPVTGVWTVTGNMSAPRHAHIAIGLADGKVLVAGGFNGATTLATAEVYDPDTGVWSPAGNLSTPRAFATATLLPNGKVLVTGGGSSGQNEPALATAELYDPATGTWTQTGTMNIARRIHSATLLQDGRVLIAAGMGGTWASPILLNSAELYHPDTGSWSTTNNLSIARVFHANGLLQNGKVLVTGGSDFISTIFDSAEVYDPETGFWSQTEPMSVPRISHTLSVLATGTVLAVGGFNNRPVETTHRRVEQYDPAAGRWTRIADLNVARGNHAATVLLDSKVLVSGGNGLDDSSHTAAEVYGALGPGPLITVAFIRGKTLFVEGTSFSEDAKVLLNDEVQKTANDNGNPTGLLRCKKAGKKIGLGETVRLKVRNADGSESAEFVFTRSDV